MTILKRGQIPDCPHCGERDEYPVEDYVVPKKYITNTEQCGWCDEYFTIREREATGDFEVLEE